MPNNTYTPVTRNNLFYNDKEFRLEEDLICDYIEEDMNQTVVVYEVDRVRTNNDAIYKDSKDEIRFKTPKELPCLYQIEDSQLKAYDNSSNNAVYALSGNLTCYIPVAMFTKYDCDIKRGDYLGVYIEEGRMSYFVVTDDGKVNVSNTAFLGAMRPVGRTVKAAPVPDTEFNGK